MALITKEQAQALLPKIGDRLMLPPTIDETTASRGSIMTTRPQPCVVVDVHHEHLWYTMQFENGFKESYKVPKWRNQDPRRPDHD